MNGFTRAEINVILRAIEAGPDDGLSLLRKQFDDELHLARACRLADQVRDALVRRSESRIAEARGESHVIEAYADGTWSERVADPIGEGTVIRAVT